MDNWYINLKLFYRVVMVRSEAVLRKHDQLGDATSAYVALEDGTFLRGVGFGAFGRRVGEIVFSTAMNGYTESLTDPSYRGQILVLTHPLVGNYGVPPDFESEKIQIEALIVAEVTEPSHPRSLKSLSEWLKENNVPGIMDVDTRFLVKKIRERGVMGCAVEVTDNHDSVDPAELIQAAKNVNYDSMRFNKSTISEMRVMSEGEKVVAVLDLGVKLGIVRTLQRYGFKVVVLPEHFDVNELLRLNPAGIVVSNGPGNPAIMHEAIDKIGVIVNAGIPTLGVCLGHQLIALALGAKTYKMKYGHRGINKPCRDLRTGRRVITLQNHGYAVDPKSLDGTGLRPWFVDCDDGTIEGLYHESLPILTVQFHPEGAPGPRDSEYVFDEFARLVNSYGKSI